MIIEIYCEEGNSDNEHSKRKKCLFQKYNLKSVFFEFFRGQFLECILWGSNFWIYFLGIYSLREQS